MSRQTPKNRKDLWNLVVHVATQRSSGLLAVGGSTPFVARIREGCLGRIDGHLDFDMRVRSAAIQGRFAASTVRRALFTAQVAGVDLGRILLELGVIPAELVGGSEAWIAEGALRIAMAGDGPWEWRDVPVDDAPGRSLLEILAGSLADVEDAREVTNWAGRIRGLIWQPDAEGTEVLPELVRKFLQGMDANRDLRDILAAAPFPARTALAWMAIAAKAGWLAEPRENVLAEPDFLDTPEDIPAVDDAEAEQQESSHTDLDVLSEIEQIEDLEDLEEIDDVEVEVDVAGGPEGEDAIAEKPQSPTKPPPGPAAPKRDVTPDRRAAAFFAAPPPDDLYARLGVPIGTAGQGIIQAYSKRFRMLQKAMVDSPSDPWLSTWKNALLEAYRILNHSDASALYEKRAKQFGATAALVADVVNEMAERALARGVQQLRQGNRFEGAKSLQEAISWRADLLQAWIALGFFQAAQGDVEEIGAALESFTRAVDLAPADPRIRYLRAVTARYAGDEEIFATDRAWLERQADPPAAWRRFLVEASAD